MNTTTKFLCIAFVSSMLLASCGGNNSEQSKTATDTAKAVPYPAIELAAVGASPEFPDAQLSIAKVSAAKQGKDSAKVSFEFDVKNYQLTMQTADTGTKMCNNSAKGQHIHFILDNQPYQALYEPKNEIVLANNTEHYLMAFLSRSYHESLKNKGAALMYHFKIDEKGNLKKMDDPKTPMVFYSRPKGDYFGKDTTNILLDFYVWNCSLAADGYKVKAQITNPDIPAHDTTITITEWAPHFIKNLGAGKSHATLTLVDKDGKNVDGPNTTVTRNFQLAASEPMKK
jgi:hypothetical protein